MMTRIFLENIPQQEFDLNIDNVVYHLRLRDGGGFTFVDIATNTEQLINGLIAGANLPIIPYPYLTRGGNFIFYCLDNEYPNYENFESTQYLYYVSDDELDA